ncbi:MAG: cell division protein FtsQ/DivIB, partial [Terriglobales bacterium]
MARKSGSTISQEELYSHSDEPVREELDDARLLDLDSEEESPFLRGQKRVSVRRGAIPRKAATGLAWTALAICAAFFCMAGVAALYHYGEHSWRFRIESSDDIEITGTHNVTRAQIMEVMAGDIGRNIFFIPLARRKTQLEQIPWVRSASVMRFAPNRIAVQIVERTPVAFARIGSKIFLIDEAGTPMDLPTGKNSFSFPVILGMNANEPPSTRRARMKIYNELIAQLDSGGAHYSQDLSEVDLSDLDDVKVLANNADGDVLVHLGSSKYLERYKVYVAHVKEWRQQFEKVESVDLRYDRQIIVNPDSEGAVTQATISTSAAKRAIAASVKPVAYIRHETAEAKSTAAAPIHPR